MFLSLLLLLPACLEEPKTPESSPESTPSGESGDSMPESSIYAGKLVISEVMSDNEGALRDAEGDSSDWIELYNPGPSRLDLEGWAVEEEAERYVFPAISVDAGAFVLVFASGKGENGPFGENHAPFKLPAEGGPLSLIAPDGVTIERVQVPALGPDQSWGRSEPVRTEVLVGTGSLARWSASAPAGWEAPAYDDSSWAEGPLPLGYDGSEGGGNPENVALGKATVQSSDGYGYNGSQAVDGDPLSFSHTGDGDLNPSLEVDFGALYQISEITLFNRTDCCAERLYNLDLSLLDSSRSLRWASDTVNPVAAGESPISPGNRLDLPLESATLARYLRVEKAAFSGSEWMSIAELVATGQRTAPYAEWIRTEVRGNPIAARITFTIDSLPSRVRASFLYDDSLRMILNEGPALVVGSNSSPHDATAPELLKLESTQFREGENLLAIETQSLDADDLLLGLELEADWITVGEAAFFMTATPGEPNGVGYTGLLSPPLFSPPRGFYAGETLISIQGDSPGSTLVYTTDGSPPSADNGIQVPSSTSAPQVSLSLQKTTALRAVILQEGYGSSPVETHSYLFLDTVIHQPATPDGWPETWEGRSEGPVAADYEMDPRVVEPDPQAMKDALLSLPSLSIVTDPAALFGPDGLYENSVERGAEWERAVSVEWILPDGSTGFAEECGLRVHGYGWRSHSVTPKHSLRLEFSSDYGEKKLEYPLFPDSSVDRFDSIVLRAGGSKTWLDFRDPAQGQYLHDAFARDTARDMGKADGHATFAHLYLNGLYWGLYNLVERPEADFGAEYFGGEAEEYDAINRRTVTNEAVDGSLDAYLELLQRADADLSTAEGLASVEEMLNIEDLIDYMLIHQYMTNRDGPCCFSHNNMRGLRRRVEGEQFRFFVWDMEYSLWEATDDSNIDIDVEGAISHVYSRLRENPDFRSRYAARAALHLGPGGALSPEKAGARYKARAEEIYDALLAESARWGDHFRATPYSREVEWQAEYDRLMNGYFPQRTERMQEQLQAVGLY